MTKEKEDYKPGFKKGESHPNPKESKAITDEPAKPADDATGAGPAVEDFAGSPAPSGINSDDKLTAEEVASASNLTAPERDIVRLVKVEQLPIDQVAAQKHMSDARVKTILGAALAKMGK